MFVHFNIQGEKQEDNAEQGVNKQFIKGGTKGERLEKSNGKRTVDR
jgi:hypothetical protein